MDRKTLLAFLFIACILMLMPYYYKLIGLAPSSPEDESTPFKQKESLSPKTQDIQPIFKNNVALLDKTLNERELAYTHEVEPIEIIVETNLYIATISSLGAGTITSFLLKDYLDHDGRPVNLIQSDLNTKNLLIQFITTDDQIITLDQPSRTAFSFYSGSTLFVQSQADSLSFYYDIEGETISKTLTFYPNSYLIKTTVDLSIISRNVISQEQFTLRWNGGLPTTESNLKDDIQYFAAHLYQGGVLDKHSGKSNKNVSFIGRTTWVAVRSKYFTAALIPQTESNYGEVTLTEHNTKKNGVLTPPKYDLAVGLSSRNTASCSIYLGPLKYRIIKDLGVDLEKTMNFGISFIRWISKGVLFLLVSMHNVIPNYGVLLVIFSVIVKIIVYPLTKKSYQSTKEMQAVQPLLIQLREKYKGDPKRLNQETMKLYKEHGVNPLGGCLPMLLQMPLLFALFIVFRTTIELRGAPFFLWIKDLSAPDTIMHLPFNIPIYGDQVSVLPILMGLSIFVQQKMSGVQAQAQQKYMMYFMTVFFFLLFNNFPSGLNLYYTLFNVLTILQQKYLVHPSIETPQLHIKT